MIGIFDSGVGGMTVAHAIEKALPNLDLIYFGDLARTPYGSKSCETIERYARENIEFLIDKGAKLIVIACNSAASVVSTAVLAQYNLPIFDVIDPAVGRVAALSCQSPKPLRVGVIGTRATIKTDVYAKKIDQVCPETSVISQACPLLVPLVEEGWVNKRETKMILRRYLYPLRIKQVDVLVLGCTHYPLLKELIQPKIGKRVAVIDSSEVVAAQLKNYLHTHRDFAATLMRDGVKQFFVSDVTDAARFTAKRIFGREIELIHT